MYLSRLVKNIHKIMINGLDQLRKTDTFIILYPKYIPPFPFT